MGTRLVSRTPGVHLTADGERQARALRDRLSPARIDAVYSSPLERTMETARIVAEPTGHEVRVHDGLIEIDFGDWTGRTFEELSHRADWRAYNAARSSAPVPNGETAIDVQRRALAALEDLRARHDGGVVAAVSHGDVIRSAVLFAAGTSLDNWWRFEIAPGSVSVLSYDARGARLVTVNEVPWRVPRA